MNLGGVANGVGMPSAGNGAANVAMQLHGQYMAALVPSQPVAGAGLGMAAGGMMGPGGDAADASAIGIQNFVKAPPKRKASPKAPANKRANAAPALQQQQQHPQQMMMMDGRVMHAQPQAAINGAGAYGIAPGGNGMQHVMSYSGAPDAGLQQPGAKKRKTAPKANAAGKPPTKAQQAAMLRAQQQQQQQHMMMQYPRFANAAAAEAYRKATQQRQQSGAGAGVVPNGSSSAEAVGTAPPGLETLYSDGSRAFTLLGFPLPDPAGASAITGKSVNNNNNGNNDQMHKHIAAAQGRSLPDDVALRNRMGEIAMAHGLRDGVHQDCIAFMQAAVRHFAKTLVGRSVAKTRLQSSVELSPQLLQQQSLLMRSRGTGAYVSDRALSHPGATPSGARPAARAPTGRQAHASAAALRPRQTVYSRDVSFVINMGAGRGGGGRGGSQGNGSGGSGVTSGRVLGAEHEMHVNRITLLEPDRRD